MCALRSCTASPRVHAAMAAAGAWTSLTRCAVPQLTTADDAFPSTCAECMPAWAHALQQRLESLEQSCPQVARLAALVAELSGRLQQAEQRIEVLECRDMQLIGPNTRLPPAGPAEMSSEPASPAGSTHCSASRTSGEPAIPDTESATPCEPAGLCSSTAHGAHAWTDRFTSSLRLHQPLLRDSADNSHSTDPAASSRQAPDSCALSSPGCSASAPDQANWQCAPDHSMLALPDDQQPREADCSPSHSGSNPGQGSSSSSLSSPDHRPGAVTYGSSASATASPNESGSGGGGSSLSSPRHSPGAVSYGSATPTIASPAESHGSAGSGGPSSLSSPEEQYSTAAAGGSHGQARCSGFEAPGGVDQEGLSNRQGLGGLYGSGFVVYRNASVATPGHAPQAPDLTPLSMAAGAPNGTGRGAGAGDWAEGLPVRLSLKELMSVSRLRYDGEADEAVDGAEDAGGVGVAGEESEGSGLEEEEEEAEEEREEEKEQHPAPSLRSLQQQSQSAAAAAAVEVIDAMPEGDAAPVLQAAPVFGAAACVAQVTAAPASPPSVRPEASPATSRLTALSQVRHAAHPRCHQRRKKQTGPGALRSYALAGHLGRAWDIFLPCRFTCVCVASGGVTTATSVGHVSASNTWQAFGIWLKHHAW